jgi:hypothetical protein
MNPPASNEFHKINSFKLTNDKYLFFDIFCKNNELILICPVYNGKTRDKYYEDINVTQVNQNSKKIFKKIEHEPIVVIIYDLHPTQAQEDQIITTTVTFQNKNQTYNLPHIKTTKDMFLTHTTLCKDDYQLLDMFKNYYTNQGVEHFYIYYNGSPSPSPPQDTTIITWDFPYWNKTNSPHDFKHHAQMGQMHHALYKYGKQNTEYMIFCDLDEILHIHDHPRAKTIKEFMKLQEFETFAFNHVWAQTLDQQIPTTQIPNTFFTGNFNEYAYGIKSKCIHKTDRILTMGIHTGNQYNMKNRHIESNHCYMFHFRHWNNTIGNIDVTNQRQYTMPTTY